MEKHCWLNVKCQTWRQQTRQHDDGIIKKFLNFQPSPDRKSMLVPLLRHAPAWSRPASSAGARWSPLPPGSSAGRLRPPASCSPSSPFPPNLAHAFAAHPPAGRNILRNGRRHRGDERTMTVSLTLLDTQPSTSAPLLRWQRFRLDFPTFYIVAYTTHETDAVRHFSCHSW